jgi:hypothetical protein
MRSFDVPFDFAGMAEETKKRVSGLSFQQALRTLAFELFAPHSVLRIRTDAETNAKESLVFLLPTVIVDGEGRKTAQTGGAARGIPADDDPLLPHMFSQTAQFEHRLTAVGCVQPALYRLGLDHDVRFADWVPIVRASPFVPPCREQLWASGLHAGFTGELANAVHLLIPQVEHSLRYLLKGRGVVTSSLLDSGIQEERGLDWILKHNEREKAIGIDYVFHLRCLLIERFGSNLRNLISHGLLSDNQVATPDALYFWWLCLHMCLLPLVARERAAEAGPAAEGAAEGGLKSRA